MLTHKAPAMYMQMVVALLTLWGRTVVSVDVCGLDSASDNSCITRAESSPPPLSSKHKNARANSSDIISASCDFSRGMCTYTQGCHQQESDVAFEWRQDSTQNGFVETTFGSGNGSDALFFATLESPLLDIVVPSCLTFTASISMSSQLVVLLNNVSKNCILNATNTASQESAETFKLNLPVTTAKVMFRGVGRGNRTATVRIFSVSLLPECCIDKDWSSFYADHPNQNDSASPQCKWTATDSELSDKWGALANGKLVDRLTAPVISATSPRRHFGCLSFQYFLTEIRDVSLTVSVLLGSGEQDEAPKWRLRNNNSWGGTFNMRTGQLPINSVQPFSVRFTARQSDASNSSLVIVEKVHYTRGNSSTPCNFQPPEAQVTEAAADKGTPVTAIVGGVSAVAVIALIAVGAIVIWKKRQKSSEKSESKETGDPIRGPDPAVMPNNSYLSTGETATVHMVTISNDESLSVYSLASPTDVAPDITNVDRSRVITGDGGVASLPPDSADDCSRQKKGKRRVQAVSTEKITEQQSSQDKADNIENQSNTHAKEVGNSSAGAFRIVCSQTAGEYDELVADFENPTTDQKSETVLKVRVYDRLGEVKGGDTSEARAGTRQAYDHVGVFNKNAYDVVRRDKTFKVMDATYHTLNSVQR